MWQRWGGGEKKKKVFHFIFVVYSLFRCHSPGFFFWEILSWRTTFFFIKATETPQTSQFLWKQTLDEPEQTKPNLNQIYSLTLQLSHKTSDNSPSLNEKCVGKVNIWKGISSIILSVMLFSTPRCGGGCLFSNFLKLKRKKKMFLKASKWEICAGFISHWTFQGHVAWLNETDLVTSCCLNQSVCFFTPRNVQNVNIAIKKTSQILVRMILSIEILHSYEMFDIDIDEIAVLSKHFCHLHEM